MALSLAVSTLMQPGSPSSSGFASPQLPFPVIAPVVLAVTFTQLPLGTAPFPNPWNGILEWPALGHRAVPEVRSGGVSPSPQTM